MIKLFDLSGKRALITGGTHGLGMAMAKGIGLAGAKLIINGHSPDKMKDALDAYRKDGIDATGYLFD
jgi:gluconate 5-dehydrogenase